MGKNILLLTTIYPAPDLNLLNNTNVCHYFAKEWVRMGYNVKVVFNYPIYSPIFHLIASLIENKLASNGSAYITTKRMKWMALRLFVSLYISLCLRLVLKRV